MDLEEVCGYYHVALMQLMPNDLQMWADICIMFTHHGWAYSLPYTGTFTALLWALTFTIISNIACGSSHSGVMGRNWTTDIQMIDDLCSTNNNYKNQYFVFTKVEYLGSWKPSRVRCRL